MSNSVVTPINKKKVKFASSLKYAVAKTASPVVQNPALLLVTVQYPKHGLPKTSKSSVKGIDVSSVNTQQSNIPQRTEAVPYTLLHLAQPVMNSVMYYGTNVQSNTVSKPVSNSNPILTRVNETDHNYVATVPKGTYSQNDLSEDIVVAPLPKSVVCTVMPKDGNETNGVSKLEAALRRSDKPKPGIGVAKFGDWEDFSSGEEGSVHIIADKPVVCRAVASLPAKFLYFGRTANKSSKKKTHGVFAKREIPKRALFGPMEGILQDKSHLSVHHCELTIENNGELKRLNVANEHTSNWMRYVRNAKSASEQNLSLQQIGKNLYFVALRKILPHEELKVWYSTAYARARNLPAIKMFRNKKVRKGNKKHGRHVSGKENVSAKSGNSVEPSKWNCSHCHKVFRSATPFNLHVLTHAADNLETEKDSFNDSTSSVAVESEAIDYNNDKRHLTCDECKKTFLSVAALACHVKSHASVKSFDCPICNEVFDKVLQLKQHIRTHSVEGNFVCPFTNCSKKYPEYRHIRNHIRRFHCEKIFGCLQCSKHFSTLDKLKLHMLSHSDHRAFSCATCGRQFKRKDKLSVHMKRIHLSPKKQSGATDTSQNEKNSTPQKEVNETDYSEYVYKCHSCVVGFKRRGMLVNHLANRHPEVKPDSVPELNLPILKANKDYFCQYCDKTYKSSSKRKSHILKNHPGKKLPPGNREKSSSKEAVANETYSQTVGSVTTNPQRCDWCHKQYASKAKLLQHQRKKHLNQLPKSLQHPKKSVTNNLDEDTDTIRDAIEKVIETEIFLPETVGVSEYETPTGDNKFFSGGEFIIDANTLKRAIRGEVLSADCSPETLSELGQIIDARPDGYFKVYQAPSGITLAHPVEVWDPFQLSLSPSSEATPLLASS